MKTKLLLLLLLAGSTHLLAQIGFAENIVTGYSYSTRGTQLVKAADLDGDNDLDIIAYGTSLNWYENVDGQGSFGQKRVLTPDSGGTQGTSLDAVDFDNDGDIDILAAIGNKLTVYKNTDGLGTFSVLQLFTLGASYPPLSAMPADMNGDGDMDILCFYTNGGGLFQGWIVWYENNGAGVFGPQQIINDVAGDLIYGSLIFADDLDNDNDLDIILGYNGYNKIAWFKNTGNAVFAAPVIISTVAGGINSITTADFDNDGDKDIISTQKTDNQVAWYENLDGFGNFADEFIITSNALATYSTFVTDINNDNTKDIIYTATNEIGWLGNAGSGHSFATPQAITNKAYGVRSVITADLDGDGKKDLVSASFDDDKVAWYKNLDANGSFGRQVVIARSIEAPNNVYRGDFDGDNDIDLLVTSQHDAKLTWFENVNGLGFYGKEHIITEEVDVGNYTPISYPVDIDGDGDLDIATRKDAALFWYENDGQGNFVIEHIIDNTNASTIIRSMDLDGDGDMDLLCGVYNADKVSWYQNLGSGAFGPEQVIMDSQGNNGSLTSLEIADMDGDNDMDFIVSSYNSYTKYYKNTDGQGTFVYQYMSILDWLMGVYPADMDGDGDKDIVGVSALGGGTFEAVVWYENTNGQGNFTVAHDVSTLSIHGNAIHAADIDSDGDIDVLTSGGTTSEPQLALYQNNGDGTFGARQSMQQLTNLAESESVTTADVDNDGDLDVVATFNYYANSTTGKVSVFENLGFLGNTISGKVIIDSDSNGCTSADLKGSNLMVISDNGSNSFATFTDQNGMYHVATTQGSFTTAITSQLPDYFVSNPASHAFNFSGLNNSHVADFCVTPTGPVNDLAVSVYPSTNDLRPGFDTHYRIVYRNTGTTALSGTVNFEYNNNKINFQDASQTVSSQTANTLGFDFANLNPFETKTIDLNFSVFSPPITNINDHVVSVVTVSPLSGDETADNNTLTLDQTVAGSYDPNDIRCLEGNQVLIADADKYLHYIIRFQNTGTASAINVRVENTLDSKLDWTSMQLESLSHNGRVEIADGSDISFIFNNIHLPASAIDEAHSHGFIAYKIKPLDNVAVGDVVNSTADIYFDFNPPVVTNTTSTQFVDFLSLPESASDAFRVYPNPAASVLNIEGNTMIEKLSVIDMNGRILMEYSFNTPTEFAELDLAGLTTGVYFLKIKSAEGTTTRKIIKE
jgi:uncharacterized repeat protein (TIGR01451 family)